VTGRIINLDVVFARQRVIGLVQSVVFLVAITKFALKLTSSL